MVKVAVILTGCGFLDGTELHESVLLLLALSQQNIEYQCFAPNKPQKDVINHLTKHPEKGERNILEESARIARGNIRDLRECKEHGFHALLMPGGFGVAKNVSTFATKQNECSVDDILRTLILDFFKAQKPIGAICIAPVIIAKVLEGKAIVKMTLGRDPSSLAHLTAMKMNAVPAGAHECVADEKHKIFTTPGYMEPPNLAAMFKGIQQLVSMVSTSF